MEFLQKGELRKVDFYDLDEKGRFVCDAEIKKVGSCAFQRVRDVVTAVEFLGVERIESFALQECRKLKKVTFSPNLQAIGFGAFSGCESLQEICLPRSLQEISVWAFRDCSALKKVEIMSPLIRDKNIGKDDICNMFANEVFFQCKNIEEFVFYGDIEFGHNFKKFPKLKTLKIANPKVAKMFWLKTIEVSPFAFKLLDRDLFFDKSFVLSCLSFIQDCFEEKFGADKVLAEKLTYEIFDFKLKQEEKNFAREEERWKEK